MSDDVTIGQTLNDRFEIVALVGRGGMSAVYEARDLLLGRTVAVKVFTIDSANDRARLKSEIQLLSALNHPNLVTVHDAYVSTPSDDEPSFLVMELVRGTSLQEMASGITLSTTDVAMLARDIGWALQVVHGAGIVHRDVKPANILIENDGAAGAPSTAKLADFGIAHSLDATRLTAVGMIVGTAAYLSPEQSESGAITTASDIYSLGLVLLECLTGHREYPGTIAESLTARLSRDPMIPAELPREWRDLLSGMTAREPDERPSATTVVSGATALISQSDAALAPNPELAEPAPTELMPTLVLPTRVDKHPEPTAAVPASATVPMEQRARVVAAEPKAPRPIVRGTIVAFAVLIIAGLVIALIVALSPRASTGGPASPGPTTPSSSAPPSVTPSPSATPTTPGKGHGNGNNGKGNGNGNGNGKKH